MVRLLAKVLPGAQTASEARLIEPISRLLLLAPARSAVSSVLNMDAHHVADVDSVDRSTFRVAAEDRH